MATTRVLLSGSTSGRPIPVVAVATPGTLIHTAVTGSVFFDEVYAFVSNVTAGIATLTIEFGGVTDPGDHACKKYAIPPFSGPIPVLTGESINGGLAVRAFSDVASALNIIGHVNRIA